MSIRRIEVNFAIPVDLTENEMRIIDEIANAAARRTETDEIVHWAAGCGCKPNWSKTDCQLLGMEPTADSPDTGEPTWDDSVFYIETASRERYETDKFDPTPRPDLLTEAREALSWALGVLDQYELGPKHLAAKKKARRALGAQKIVAKETT